MKYLIYLRPPETLQNLFHSFRENSQYYLLDMPRAGDHCTLMTAIAFLFRISFPPTSRT